MCVLLCVCCSVCAAAVSAAVCALYVGGQSMFRHFVYLHNFVHLLVAWLKWILGTFKLFTFKERTYFKAVSLALIILAKATSD